MRQTAGYTLSTITKKWRHNDRTTKFPQWQTLCTVIEVGGVRKVGTAMKQWALINPSLHTFKYKPRGRRYLRFCTIIPVKSEICLLSYSCILSSLHLSLFFIMASKFSHLFLISPFSCIWLVFCYSVLSEKCTVSLWKS